MKTLQSPAHTAEESIRASGLGTDNRQRGTEEIKAWKAPLVAEGMEVEAGASTSSA